MPFGLNVTTKDGLCPRHVDIASLRGKINAAVANLPRYENLPATLEAEQNKIVEWTRRLNVRLAEPTPWSDGAY
ncbi:hypothetical protein TWF281_010828 [Arthrobotrys megalospora]